jgi:hypothetical protein
MDIMIHGQVVECANKGILTQHHTEYEDDEVEDEDEGDDGPSRTVQTPRVMLVTMVC